MKGKNIPVEIQYSELDEDFLSDDAFDWPHAFPSIPTYDKYDRYCT